MHEHPLQQHGELEQKTRRLIVRLAYDPGDLESPQIRYLMNAAEILGLPCAHLIASLAIVHYDLPRVPLGDSEGARCIVCHLMIRPRALWLIGDKHPVHRACRPIHPEDWVDDDE